MPLTRDNKGHVLVPAEPFTQWLRDRHDELARAIDASELTHRTFAPGVKWPAVKEVADRLPVTPRNVYRWLEGLSGGDKNGGPVKRATHYQLAAVVAPTMEAFGWQPWMIYPWEQLDGLPHPEPVTHCPTCDDAATPIHGVCPWCETVVAHHAFRDFILDRALIPERVVQEALLLRQAKVGVGDVARQLCGHAGLPLSRFKQVIRDEFHARGAEWHMSDRDPLPDAKWSHSRRVERGPYRARTAEIV